MSARLPDMEEQKELQVGRSVPCRRESNGF